jgi:hypothetical protein
MVTMVTMVTEVTMMRARTLSRIRDLFHLIKVARWPLLFAAAALIGRCRRLVDVTSRKACNINHFQRHAAQ